MNTMTREPLVSVVINCYNGEEYLSQALESVLSQTYSNWEVIFWDNQSTDKSAKIFKSYNDPRFVYCYAPKHTWLYEARNYAVERTKGEFIAFLDVDDLWLPEKLESQISLFGDVNIGLVAGDYYEHYEQLGTRQLFTIVVPSHNKIIESLLQGNFIGMFTIIVRASALKQLDQPFDASYHIIGDFDMLIRIFENWKLGWVHQPVGVYRIHGNNESLKRKKMQIDEEASWIVKMKNNAAVSGIKAFKLFSDMVLYKDAMYFLNQKKLTFALQKAYTISSYQLRIRCIIKCLYLSLTKKQLSN
ncbi:glycosyltransferase [Daejeonella sp.]|uniref:glycosyltransferase family 2 protein n=1 Tax=Daejeonella sp. TaxID=2805397 RepID=UPI002BB1F594|nr:glycosyltransferase [Daejeonella sp.]HQT58835.1 glycosyltransferase [Daejeonella sp.]